MSSVLNFLIQYKSIFIFYLAVVIFLIIKHKQLEFQAKVIILYRMKFGLKFIEKCAQKFREWIIVIGYIGVGVGYLGLIFISFILVKSLYDLITTPAAASGVSLVLPGINVPGLGVLPFWYWVIAIFLIALVHEFAHGIVARAHNINVKNTGMVLLGPIIGAFVEPNEKKMSKEKDIVQYSVFAAGPFANIILAVVALVLLNFLFVPLQHGMTEPTGFTFDDYAGEALPFEQAGIMPGTLITGIDKHQVDGFEKFSDRLYCKAAGEEIEINTAENDYPVVLADSPDKPGKGYMGIQNIHNEFEIKEEYSEGVWSSAYYALDWINGFLRWLFLLSLGIGLFNLLPLPIVDGGRMLQITLHKVRGTNKGERSFRKISFFFLLVLLLSLFYPFLSNLF
jgi:membrane-associated protease RseP (regulator of RpoE activity)